MPSSDREPSIASASEPADLSSTTHYSLSHAVNARRSEYVRPHRIRIKVGTWNVAGCPGTDKDLASWFVDGEGTEPRFDSNLARLNLSEDSIVQNAETESKENSSQAQGSGRSGNTSSAEGQGQKNHPDDHEEEPEVRLPGGDRIGLYVLGLQEIVSLNLVHQSFYSDPSSIAKWQDALEAALPKGYTLVACQQLVGLLLLVYASPEVASTISNESTVAVGTGLLGYMGNKGAISSRIILGETTRLVFANCHLASGHDQASLDRRCWDYNKVLSQTKFTPINNHGVAEEEGEKLGDEDFTFCFGDLNFRLDGLPGDDIRRLLMLHARGEYDVNKKDKENLPADGDDAVIILRNNADGDSDGTSTPGMVSREASFDKENEDDESIELPDPDDFVPDPRDDPASLQTTIDSLLPHDQLRKMIKGRKAFHEGWREGPITFLPTYKYDVGTVGLFDSSEKKRAPSWCDRILFRTRTDLNDYEQRCQDEVEAKKKDDEMKQRGIDQAADDESVLFDYDPGADSSTENLAPSEANYDYDEYDEEEEDEGQQVTTKEGFADKIKLDIYTSHQRIMSSDHKPLVAIFTLDYDAVVPELKAKVHAEVAKELDRAENEGRPGITIVVDSKDASDKKEGEASDGSDGVDFGEVGFLKKKARYLTIANTGRVPAKFSFVEKPELPEDDGGQYEWLEVNFDLFQEDQDEKKNSLRQEITLEPGETVNAVLQVVVRNLAHVRALNEETAKLEDVLVLRVREGRDHFVPVRATWRPTCFGRSLEELIRLPRGGIRELVKERQKGGSVPYTLEVHSSSPMELFKLTEAIEALTERLIADENMLEDCKIPRDRPGWPFDERSWQTTEAEDHEELRTAIIDALEEHKSVLDTLKADVPTIKRLEVVSEVLLLFLRSMTDGIITAALWANIEQALPGIGSSTSGRTPEQIEDDKSAILDILSSAPYYNISFVFLTSMLARVANELVPLNKDELDALSSRKKPTGATLGKRSLSFRRNPGAAGVDEAVIQRRLAWERRAAEVFGAAICRTGGGGSGSAKEKKTLEERMRGVVEVFVRRDGA
ncbi:type II inositol-1,4,5-trisphosphate 5-phosphatase [Xylariomycetidae sp. FL2044]|nr:type II inositol-1,4,5-trisphosphate 5-phosphatase [Xylariomycetidae sp. FL2044]KAH9901697.1 type II inositol-1,4,5-trisphosphate 5-phosphatase [Xylariomycetidae sp. FL2044]KAH9901702.1 type II inositol-1,4,5-trisphosphate 5-phosphatase [Xylariomycetidae sp. FL2044]